MQQWLFVYRQTAAVTMSTVAHQNSNVIYLSKNVLVKGAFALGGLTLNLPTNHPHLIEKDFLRTRILCALMAILNVNQDKLVVNWQVVIMAAVPYQRYEA
jgi:hypothetical protein